MPSRVRVLLQLSVSVATKLHTLGGKVLSDLCALYCCIFNLELSPDLDLCINNYIFSQPEFHFCPNLNERLTLIIVINKG